MDTEPIIEQATAYYREYVSAIRDVLHAMSKEQLELFALSLIIGKQQPEK